MSNRIVHGFTDVVGRTNFTPNGNFYVANRNGGATSGKVVPGLYFVDCWKFARDVPYAYLTAGGHPKLKYQLDRADGGIRLYGSEVAPALYGAGTSRNLAYILCDDSTMFGMAGCRSGSDYLVTAAVNVKAKPPVSGAAGSTALRVFVTPRLPLNGAALVRNVPFAMRGGNAGARGQAVSIYKVPIGTTNDHGMIITVEWVGAGPIDLTLSNARELVGGFLHPPLAPVSVVDDVNRCRAWYQAMHTVQCVPIRVASGPSSRVMISLPFAPSMLGVPSIVVSSLSVTCGQSPLNGGAEGDDSANWAVTSTTATGYGCTIELTRGSVTSTNEWAMVNCVVEAVVTTP